MQNALLKRLNNDSLADYITHLDKISNRAVIYEKLKLSEDGKFLIQDLKDDLEFVRKMYGGLLCMEGVEVALSSLQAQERLLIQFIQRIEQSPALVSAIEETTQAVSVELEQRGKRNERASFVTSTHKKEMNDGTQG